MFLTIPKCKEFYTYQMADVKNLLHILMPYGIEVFSYIF